MTLVPCSLAEANAYVALHHRHHAPTPVAKFSIAAMDDEGQIVGVVVVGLPKARMAMDDWTLEVTRLATNGARNACSFLYGAARRAAFALGYSRLLTYTLVEEDGASLRASGFAFDGLVEGESWKRRGRWSVDDRNPIGDKKRWVAGAKRAVQRPAFPATDDGQGVLDLFGSG